MPASPSFLQSRWLRLRVPCARLPRHHGLRHPREYTPSRASKTGHVSPAPLLVRSFGAGRHLTPNDHYRHHRSCTTTTWIQLSMELDLASDSYQVQNLSISIVEIWTHGLTVHHPECRSPTTMASGLPPLIRPRLKVVASPEAAVLVGGPAVRVTVRARAAVADVPPRVVRLLVPRHQRCGRVTDIAYPLRQALT